MPSNEGRDAPFISPRFASTIISALQIESPRTELDSHADSPVVGDNARILKHMNKFVQVSGFSDQLGNLTRVPVVQAAVMFDCQYTGKEYVMHINNALYVKGMQVNLIPPFMMRLAGIEVNECPKFMAKEPKETHHSIYFPDDDLRIALQIERTVSYIPTRCPQVDDVSGEYKSYDLTPDTDEWDPANPTYSNQEHAMLDYKGEIKIQKRKESRQLFSVRGEPCEDPVSEVSAVLTSISNTLDHGNFADSVMKIYSVSSTDRRYKASVEDVMRAMNCSRDVARRTLRCTTQRCVRSLENPSMSRRYNTNDRMLRYRRITCDMFMDTFFSKIASVRGFKCAQMFVTDFNYIHVSPMKGRREIPNAVKNMFKTRGVPNSLIMDGAREQVYGETRRLCQQASCVIKELEKETQWANRAELHIGLAKKAMYRSMKRAHSPMKLWCYCLERYEKINNKLAKDTFQLHGQTPEFLATGVASDISDVCEYDWYEWVYFRDRAASFPNNPERLGRCLGPAEHHGTAMSQWVMNNKGTVLPIQSLRVLTQSEMNSPSEKQKRADFDAGIKKKFGDSIVDVEPTTEVDEPEMDDLYEDELENGEDSTMPEADDIDGYDRFINAEVLMPRDGEHMHAAKVIGRSVDDDGNMIGKYHDQPYLNTRVYDVMFPDGSVEQFAANNIAMNIYTQVDDEGYRYQLMDDIIDHRKTSAAAVDTASDRNGKEKSYKRITTKGWFFLVKWKDGTESWKPLKDLKESNQLDVALYAQKHGLINEPAFKWWVPYALKKKDRIISAIRARIKVKTHKYGVRIPSTVEEAYEIDKMNNNTFWRDAIAKEMKNVSVAFEFLEEGQDPPPGYKFMPCHMVFDVKMDFTRKARFVATGCMSADPEGTTYAGVVSRESVRIALTYAALHDLEVFAADVQNAYLQAPSSEKHWTIAGPEFGSRAGTKMLIVRALYGGKAAGRDFRNHLRECMKHLKYEFCDADHDVWMRKGVRDDGTEYYEYLLLYTDDCLCVSEHPREALMEVNAYFKLKPESVGPPKIYLGGKVSKHVLPSGVWAYTFSSSQYVQEAVKNVEEYLEKRKMKLTKRATSPITADYRPELDQSSELSPKEASYFQSLIGVLRWAVELGRIDVTTEVSMLSSHLAMPRDGHLQQLFHIFAYLKAHHNSRLVFDPTYPDIDYEKFEKEDWKSFYGKVKEELPENMPEAIGKELIITCYVDADHAGEKLTRRSRTGFIVFVNSAPVYWYSKRQNSIETSSFGSEFVAMKQACEYLRGLRFKLRMMGIPVTEPCFVMGDNQSVLSNISIPSSMLKKKSNSIAYHFVREGTAKDEWRFQYIKSANNPADILASARAGGIDRKRKVSMMLYDIYD